MTKINAVYRNGNWDNLPDISLAFWLSLVHPMKATSKCQNTSSLFVPTVEVASHMDMTDFPSLYLE